MDKRFLLALLLTAIVVFVTPLLFPPAPGSRAPAGGGGRDADSARKTAASAKVPEPAPAVTESAGAAAGRGGAPASADSVAATAPSVGPADTVVVTTPRVTYRFSTRGASPIGATLRTYRALSPEGGNVELTRPGLPLLRYRLVAGSDTLALDRLPFAVDRPQTGPRAGDAGATEARPLTFRAMAGGREVAITYTFAPDSYLVRVRGQVRGARAEGSSLLITLPNGLPSHEADTLDDQRQLAYVVKPVQDGATSVSFDNLDPGERRVETSPLTWVASKNKYFLVALLTPEDPGGGRGRSRQPSSLAARASRAWPPTPVPP